MMANKPILTIEFVKIEEGDREVIRVSVNGSTPEHAVGTVMSGQELLVVVQGLANLTHFYAQLMGQKITGTIEVDKTPHGDGTQ